LACVNLSEGGIERPALLVWISLAGVSDGLEQPQAH
jgi:hypothetical protein